MKGDKVVFKVSEHTAEPPYVLGNFPRIEIIFVCQDRGKEDQVEKPNKSDLYTELKNLKDLKDSGILTQEEFDMQKKKILSAN